MLQLINCLEDKMNKKLGNLVLESMDSDDVNLFAIESLNLSNEDVYFNLVLTISFYGEEGGNYFYTTLATPESILKNINGYLLISNRTLLVRYFDFSLLQKSIEEIVLSCSRDSWEKSCEELTKYFYWEYES